MQGIDIQILGREEVDWIEESEIFCSEHFGLWAVYKVYVNELKKFEQSMIEIGTHSDEAQRPPYPRARR